MRGFRNVRIEPGLLLAIVGGNDPGKVGWPESMKAAVRAVGFELDADGNFHEIAAAGA